MPGKDLETFGHAAIQPHRVPVVRDDRERTRPEDVALDLERREVLSEVSDRGRGGLVDEHVLGGGLRTEVIDQRVTLIRFGGHLPKGEYDVDHGRAEGKTDATKFH